MALPICYFLIHTVYYDKIVVPRCYILILLVFYNTTALPFCYVFRLVIQFSKLDLQICEFSSVYDNRFVELVSSDHWGNSLIIILYKHVQYKLIQLPFMLLLLLSHTILFTYLTLYCLLISHYINYIFHTILFTYFTIQYSLITNWPTYQFCFYYIAR